MSDRRRPRVGVIGVGRAGGALSRALHTRGYTVASVWSRTRARAEALADEVGARVASTPCDVAPAADLIILAVSDDVLGSIAASIARWCARLPNSRRMVAHLSGTYGADVLQPIADAGALIGALHPLQTFADERSPIPGGTTFAIEAAEPLRSVLLSLVDSLDGRPLHLAAGDRAIYHAAAAMTANYVVTLISQAVELLEQAGVAPDQGLQALLPLLRGAVNNLERLGLPHALTGPIARGDAGTLARHLAALAERAPHVLPVYRELGIATLPLAAVRGAPADRLREMEELFNRRQETLDRRQW